MAGGLSQDPLAYTPSLDRSRRTTVSATSATPATATVHGYFVGADGAVHAELGADRADLESMGFDGSVGSVVVASVTGGSVNLAVGLGDAGSADAARLRDAAAAFARAAANHERLALMLSELGSLSAATAAQAVTEGVLLARYRYDVLRSESTGQATERADPHRRRPRRALQTAPERGQSLAARHRPGARPGQHTAQPPDRVADGRHRRRARRRARLRRRGVRRGRDCVEMGIGGILGVNAGSAEPPRLIKLTYSPDRRHRPPGDGRQGHHVRLGRPRPQARRCRPRGHEERHVRRGRDPCRRGGAGRDRLPGPRSPAT